MPSAVSGLGFSKGRSRSPEGSKVSASDELVFYLGFIISEKLNTPILSGVTYYYLQHGNSVLRIC